MTDRGAGEIDTGQYDNDTETLPTGACVLFRLRALRELLQDGELYDGDFFTYREDCDLAMRWLRRGKRAVFVPAAKAWHYRGLYGAERQTLWQRWRNRRRHQRPRAAAYGTRNQLFVLLKNLTVWEFTRAAPRIIAAEGSRVLYGFLFEPETRRLLLTMLPLVPKMLRKRGL